MRLAGSRSLFPSNHHGVVIDLILIAANLFIFPLLTSRVQGLFERSFGNDDGAFASLGILMLLILAGRLAGLYLKRFPLQSRLESSETTSFPAYFFVFNTPVLILTAAFVVTVVTALLASVGLLEVTASGQPKDSAFTTTAGLLLMIAVIGAEIWFIYRLTRPLSAKEIELRERGDFRFTMISELAADFGLFAYMMIWQIFYTSTVVPALLDFPGGAASVGHYMISVILLAVAFVLFYVSPRVVFLVEDRKHLGTWLLIFGVFVASIGRYLV